MNYGKPLYLNTAEALAAALRIAGLTRDAELLLAPFASGGAFFALNADAFEAYAAANPQQRGAQDDEPPSLGDSLAFLLRRSDAQRKTLTDEYLAPEHVLLALLAHAAGFAAEEHREWRALLARVPWVRTA